MSGDWSVSGGGTGIEARFDDLLRVARILDDAADVLRERAARDALLAGHGDVLEAAVLCPLEVAQVEAAVLGATTLPGGALPLGVQLEALALTVQSGVDLYRDADQLLSDIGEEATHDLAFAAGLGMVANPVLLGGLAVLAARDPEATQAFLHDHPWLLEAATRGAPGLAQGGAFGLAALLGPGGPALLAALSGGHWPTSDYEQSVAGLQALLGLAGLVQDTGRFSPRETGGLVDQKWLETGADVFLGNLAVRQSQVVYPTPQNPGSQVEVVPVWRDGEVVSYVVQIPGTDPAGGFTHGTSPYDWTTDVQEMTGEGSQVRAAIVRALEMAELHGKPVMLSGHSLGGILAASMAADDGIRERFNIQSVVTYGSPVARFDIPDDVSVLSVEHRQDLVPMLEGRANPGGAHWTTVRTDVPGGARDIEGAHHHGPRGYGATLAALDDLDGLPDDVRRSMEHWQQQNAVFFGGGSAPPGAVPHRVYDLDHDG